MLKSQRARRVLRQMRMWSASVAGGILLFSGVAAAAIDFSRQQAFDIAPQALPAALVEFSRQAGVQFTAPGSAISQVRSSGVKGEYGPSAALGLLLRDTGFTFRIVDEGTVAITSEAVAAGERGHDARGSTNTGSKDASGDDAKGAQKSSFWDRFRLAQVDRGASADAASLNRNGESSDRASGTTSVPLEEVVVTAQKRIERLHDVPVPVTAISGATLVDSNQLRIQDYYSKIPGLSLTSDGLFGSQSLTIRGITTGPGANPTVGVVVDDVPYGGTSTITQADNIPDIDPGELARVEVLRGPQGTLYGASSMGGLLKFVTADPSTDDVSGRVQGGTSGVSHGTGLGYNIRGSINVPVNDTLAMRASAFSRREPGYIDDPITHSDGVNEERVRGGRLSALWRPSEAASLKLSALYQKDVADGSSDVDRPVNGYAGPPLGDLQQNRLRGTGGFDKTLQAYSATLTAKLGRAELTAITGFNVNDVTSSFDDTYALGDAYTLPTFGVAGTPEPYHNRTKKINQEVRVSFPVGQQVEWVWGLFYTHEHNNLTEQFLAVDPVTNALVSAWARFDALATYTEYAAFTNLTYRFSDRFDIQIGGRESQVRGSFQEVDTGRLDLFLETSPFITPEADSKKYAFTYLLTPRFKVTPDLMVYARLASGYRAGGPNNGAAAFGLPASFGPDKTQNFEIGTKADFLGHSFSVDASVYYIDWKDIQVAGFDPNADIGYVANANRARSEGVELSVESKPLTGLSISAWVAWNDAALKESFPLASLSYGLAGDRLPTSARISGNLSIEQRFALTARVSGFVGGSVSYTGERQGIFASSFDPDHVRQIYPPYAKTDLRVGAQVEAWTLNVFANNVTDRRGVVAGGVGYFPSSAFRFIQPRTVGVSVSRTLR